jgi:hypothetical protein
VKEKDGRRKISDRPVLYFAIHFIAIRGLSRAEATP